MYFNTDSSVDASVDMWDFIISIECPWKCYKMSSESGGFIVPIGKILCQYILTYLKECAEQANSESFALHTLEFKLLWVLLDSF